ncbi:MAG: heparan-alpha-glucosaminide N-acetyltransferase [Methanocorpusculum sp.]|nr:heparan-alpha-glucosaminide N-acetyltransferase [Methanocorpusculum sp.]
MVEPAVTPLKERYWEIDAVRGISLIGMIFFHTIFILSVFHIIDGSVWVWVCSYIEFGTAIFVIISGMALVLRHARMADKPRKDYYLAIVKRAVEIIIIGVAVAVICSVLIYFFIGDGRYMYFNFLQMMGVCMLISIPFLRFGKWNFIPAVLIFILGLFLETLSGPAFLMPFGILPDGFMPRDYFPFVKWLGVMLLGVGLGSVFYPHGFRRFSLPKANSVAKALAVVGKYPLQIYLIHLPVIGAVVFLIVVISGLLGFPIGYI